MFVHFYSTTLPCLLAKAAPCKIFLVWGSGQYNQFSRMLSYQMLTLDDHLCYFCKASWNFTTEIHMNKTPDQTTEDNSPMGIAQFPFLCRRLIKSAFIVYVD